MTLEQIAGDISFFCEMLPGGVSVSPIQRGKRHWHFESCFLTSQSATLVVCHMCIHACVHFCMNVIYMYAYIPLHVHAYIYIYTYI